MRRFSATCAARTPHSVSLQSAFPAARSACSSIRRGIIVFVLGLAIALVSGFFATTPVSAADGTWTSTAGGLWSDSANWLGGTVANTQGCTADFSTINISGDTTVHVDSSRTIGSLVFGDSATSSAGGWTLDDNGNSANILTLKDYPTTIQVNELGDGKAATVSVRLAGNGGLRKTGDGTLILSAANTYTGATGVIAGSLVYGANDAISTGAVTVSGGTLSMGVYSDSVGQITVNGGGYISSSGSLTSTSSLVIGDSSGGIVEITAGGCLQNSAASRIGYGESAVGCVNISGAGSKWNNGAILYVGDYGSGALNITNGGSVSSTVSGDSASLGYRSGSSGTVTVGGTGSTWTNKGQLYIGQSGNGSLSITDGGSTTCNKATIGANTGSSGSVTVKGANSTWTNSGTLEIGRGTLDITGGGTVTCSSCTIANNTGTAGTVTVSGSGSTWTNSSLLYVGYLGSGTLKIADGGSVVNSSFGAIAVSYGSTGTVTVDGPGSKWVNNSNLSVGEAGPGTLSITGGGSVSVALTAYVGNSSSGTVTIDKAGSTWTCKRDLYVGYGGDGVLEITNGGSASTGRSAAIGSGNNVSGRVTVDGTTRHGPTAAVWLSAYRARGR